MLCLAIVKAPLAVSNCGLDRPPHVLGPCVAQHQTQFRDPRHNLFLRPSSVLSLGVIAAATNGRSAAESCFLLVIAHGPLSSA